MEFERRTIERADDSAQNVYRKIELVHRFSLSILSALELKNKGRQLVFHCTLVKISALLTKESL